MEIREQIPRMALVWVLIAVLAVILPQALHLPVWVLATAVACVAWRITIHIGKLDYPGPLLRATLVVFTLVLAIVQIREIGAGLDFAASLLVLGFVFKLTEMRSRRDIYVVICLCFVMCMIAFIYSQSVVTTVYILVCLPLILLVMLSMNRAPERSGLRDGLHFAGVLTMQSIPLMVVLFMVFPRIAPLWAVPLPASNNRTGVSDEMTPGAISELGRSTDLAFRASFVNGEQLPHEELYWRGLVLEDFDGITWRRRNSLFLSAAAARGNFEVNYDGRMVMRGPQLDYDIILEPSQRPWLYGLHLAEPRSAGVSRGRNFELFNGNVVAQRLNYALRSYPQAQTDVFLLDSMRARTLQLPRDGNTASREFAQSLRQEHPDDSAYVDAVLGYFRQQPFYYTLTPPVLTGDHVDDFLFNTRQGFCEHYAGSFTFLMRAAGIPARVVVGYQGAEYNRFENYLMVYQYNAHAWSEVWLEGQGWVRVDPTGAVAPDRISLGVEAALQGDPAFMDDALFSMMRRFRAMNLVSTLRQRLDAIEYEWNRRVVSYDEDVQLEFLERFLGAVTLPRVVALILIVIAAVLVMVGCSIIRPVSRRPRPAEALYRAACRRLARNGLPRRTGEGPWDYCRRVEQERPLLAAGCRELTELYVSLNYAPSPMEAAERRLKLRELRKISLRFAPRVLFS